MGETAFVFSFSQYVQSSDMTTCKNSFALVLSCPRKTQFSMYTNELAHYLGGLDRKAPFFFC